METLIWLTLLYTLLVLLRKYSDGDSVMLDLFSLSLSVFFSHASWHLGPLLYLSLQRQVGWNRSKNRDRVQIGGEQA